MRVRFKPLCEAKPRARWRILVRPIPGVWIERPLPDGDDADAVIHASELATEERQQVCLILLDRWSLWFNEEGVISGISPRSATKASPPYMTAEDGAPFVFTSDL